MLVEHWILFGALLLTFALTNYWRYDVLALLALLIVTLTGLVPVENAFSGFGNRAVVIVAAVFVISRALRNSGVVDWIGDELVRLRGGALIQLAALTVMVAALSAFMNDVGVVALLLPVAVEIAHKKQLPASLFLMPMAVASRLGGMLTLIGTPTNLILSSVREQTGAAPFGMFDYTPAGLPVAVIALLFVILAGRRLVPSRRGEAPAEDLFDVEQYITEVRITAGCKLDEKRLPAINEYVDNPVNVIGLVRDGERRLPPGPHTVFRAGDIVTLQVEAEDLEELVTEAGLELVGSKDLARADLESDEVALIEAVITPDSLMVGESASSLNLRHRYSVNLLAISRQGRRLRARLDRIRLHSGDVLLLQSPIDSAKDALSTLGCLPLAHRGLRIGQPRRMLASVAIFATALVLAALNYVPVQLAFVAAVLVMVVGGFVSLREAYGSINWPIIILMGAMIPVGEALQTTSAAGLIADTLLRIASQISPIAILAFVMVVTMLMSDVVNNTTTAVVMAPIAISMANQLGVSVDPFLIAIGISASCAFLTPTGHQSNTLVMGPGGYRFGDYWRLGLCLEVLVILIGLPLILTVWPL